MSLDLTLLPFFTADESFNFSQTNLPMQSNTRDLFAAIRDLVEDFNRGNSVNFIKGDKKMCGEVPKDFMCHMSKNKEGELSYGKLSEDPYGERMMWVRVSLLLTLKDHVGVNRNMKNEAAFKYLEALDPDIKVALYWH